MTTTNRAIKIGLIWDRNTDSPMVIDAGISEKGVIKWGMDTSGRAQYRITTARGELDIVDREGALDIEKRTEGTLLTPMGRRAEIGELAGHNIGILVMPREADSNSGYLWNGLFRFAKAGRTGISSLSLDSLSSARMRQRASYLRKSRGEGAPRFADLAFEISEALALPEDMEMQVGELNGPSDVNYTGTVQGLLREAGLWGQGVAVENSEGKSYIISREQMGVRQRDWEPIVIEPSRNIELNVTTDITVENPILPGALDVADIIIEDPGRSHGHGRPFAFGSQGTDMYVDSSTDGLFRYRFDNNTYTSTGIQPELLSGRRPTASNNIQHLALSESALMIGDDSSRIYVQRREGINRHVTQSIVLGMLDMDRQGNNTYILTNNNVLLFQVTSDNRPTSPTLTLPVFFSLDEAVSNNSWIGVGSRGIDIVDVDNRNIYYYDFSGVLRRKLDLDNLISRSADIGGIVSVGVRVYVVQLIESALSIPSSRRWGFRLHGIDYGTISTSVLELPEPAPSWRVADGAGRKPFNEKPQTTLVFNQLDFTENDQSRTIEVNSGLLPPKKESLSRWSPRNPFNTEAGFWRGDAERWLEGLNTDPPTTLSFNVHVTNMPWQWQIALNKRLDVSSRLAVRISEDTVADCIVIGRNIQWKGPVLVYGVNAWVTGKRPVITDNVLEWLGEDLTWLGEDVTWL